VVRGRRDGYPMSLGKNERGQTFVRLSVVELDELIDGCTRCATAAQHTSQMCEQAAAAFRNEAATLNSCKHMFEKFRRAF
jgi:hypothetical protein